MESETVANDDDKFKKSNKSNQSLSTIAEEPKSIPNVSSKSEVHSGRDVQENEQSTNPRKPWQPIRVRQKRHTSIALKGTSQEMVLEHGRPTTIELQERVTTHMAISGKPLFKSTVSDLTPTRRLSTCLMRNHELRNISALQDALQINQDIKEHEILKQLYHTQDRVAPSSSHLKSGSTSGTQTDIATPEISEGKRQLFYLMGLQGDDEYESVASVPEMVQEEKEETGGSLAMRKAQKYLRTHKIFELFQFIAAHLLTNLPDNPIAFIIDLLHECLIYRTGLCEPPLLYNHKHLECLFYLIDKMRTGYIEPEEYKTGLRTLGICSFNHNPTLTKDCMVTKEVFIEEAYDCLCNLLNNMIRTEGGTLPGLLYQALSPPLSSLSSSSNAEDQQSREKSLKSNIFFD